MFGLGMGEALILLAVVLLLFGGKKLPELGNSMGKALTNFKKGMKESANDDQNSIDSKNEKDA
jgi:sec-independent protein translocase protein TatA